MSRPVVMLVIACLARVAAAQPGLTTPTEPPSVQASTSPSHTIAFAINSPIMWSDSIAIGGSLYVGLDAHHVIRANAATYKLHSSTIGDLISVAGNGEGDEAGYTGGTTDVGVGWMYFPRRAYDGPMYEAGALVRAQRFSVEDEFAPIDKITTDTNVYAARALIGWSWNYRGVFFSLSAGMAVGYERGSELQQKQPDYLDPMTTTVRVSRFYKSGEAFARLGYAFDL